MTDFDDATWAYRILTGGLGQCGCGQPEQVAEMVLVILRAAPLHGLWTRPHTYDNESGIYTLDDGTDEEHDLFGLLQSPEGQFVVNVMNAADLLEHGGSAGGSWITDKGTKLLAIVERLGLDVVMEPDSIERPDDLDCPATMGDVRCQGKTGHLGMHEYHGPATGDDLLSRDTPEGFSIVGDIDLAWADHGALDLGIIRDVPVGTATMLRNLVEVLRATDAGFEMLADMLNVVPAKTSKAQSDLLMMASWLEDHPDIDAAMLTVITAADVDGG